MASATFDLEHWPRATVTKTGALLHAVIDNIDGMAPQREPSDKGEGNEVSRGILSFDPITVETSEGVNHFVALCGEAVTSAAQSTLGSLPITEDVMIRIRVTNSVNAALRMLGVDV